MSALMTPRRSRRGRRTRPAPAPGGQPALFGAGSATVATPAAPGLEAVTAPAAPDPAAVAVPAAPARGSEAAPAAPRPAAVPSATTPEGETHTTARAHRHGPTLDDLVAGAWEGLLAGAPADCLVCGAPVAPRHSAGAGIVGGRCGGCGTTVS